MSPPTSMIFASKFQKFAVGQPPIPTGSYSKPYNGPLKLYKQLRDRIHTEKGFRKCYQNGNDYEPVSEIERGYSSIFYSTYNSDDAINLSNIIRLLKPTFSKAQVALILYAVKKLFNVQNPKATPWVMNAGGIA